jgi:predicted component of type VI protein secretion system
MLLTVRYRHALSMLNQNLPQNISDKLACSIENTVSSSLRHELAVLGNSIHKYEQAQECMKQDIISAVDGAIIHNNNSLRTIGDQIGCIPQTISRQLNQHQSNENFENLGSNRMLKELITEQSHELRMLRGSLNTITNNCKPAPRGSTKELTLASKTSLSELKVVSARWFVHLYFP